MCLKYFLWAALGLLGHCSLLAADPSAAPDLKTLEAKSQLSKGNLARLQKVFAKAQGGGKVVVGVIGGSITMGTGASEPINKYAQRVASWWRSTFPKAQIEFINAGIGATRSDYGALRAQRDLLFHQPDFVIVEFAVNDPNDSYAKPYEGLIRQILDQPQQPALMLLFMTMTDGETSQDWQAKIGNYYHLPMVSYRDAIWPLIQSKQVLPADLSADGTHPNDRGHQYAADFVTTFLQMALAAPAEAMEPVPPPLNADLYEHTALYQGADAKPTADQGWTFDTDHWESDKPGSVLEFQLKGESIIVLYWRVKGAMGIARTTIDGVSATDHDSWFSATWGGYLTLDLIGSNLRPGMHTVRVELLPDKNPGSTGNEFLLYGFGTAGADDRA
jgi:lysophospholipase L1-like esterase